MIKKKNKNNRTIKGGLLGLGIKSSYSEEIYSSFSPRIEYTTHNIKSKNKLEYLFYERNFDFLNVTSPFKEIVLQFLDYKSDIVEKTGVCNLVVNRKGVLKGYNTDVYGFKKLLEKNCVDVKNKNVLILGNGATSKTIKYTLEEMGVNNIYVACRNKKKEFEYFFDEAPKDANIIINATPCGKQISDKRLVFLKQYKKLETVIDVVYNPYKTLLLVDAKELGKGAISGFDMLVNQAKQAISLVTNTLYPTFLWENLRTEILCSKLNLVLIGLPTAGKSKMCKELKKFLTSKTKTAFYDTDKIIESVTKMPIRQIFLDYGEERFRTYERWAVYGLKKIKGAVIATGGGVPIDKHNYELLSRNGFFVYLKKTNFDDFKADKNRPLLKSKEDLKELYKKRNPIYEKRADLTLSSNVDAQTLLKEAFNAIDNS